MSVENPVVSTWEGANRRAYLLQGVTLFNWVDDIYKEYRNWRRTNESARKWAPLLKANGNDPKGGGKFSSRYITLLDGFRVIPYDENILIEVTGEAITDNADIDPDPFDTSTRTQPVKLYITIVPEALFPISFLPWLCSLSFTSIVSSNLLAGR